MSRPASSWSRRKQASASSYCSRKRRVTIASRNMRVPRFSVYQLGRGSEPVIVVGSMMSLVPRYIVDVSQNAKRDFQLFTAGGIAYRLHTDSKKSRWQQRLAHGTHA